MNNSFWKFIGNTLLGLLGACIMGVGVFFIIGLFDLIALYPSIILWIPAVVIFFYFVANSTYDDLVKEKENRIKTLETEKESIESKFNIERDELIKEQNTQLKKLEVETKVWKDSLKEKSSGFPTLFYYIESFETLIDNAVSGTLLNKVRPAQRSAEVVKEETKKRRIAERESRMTKAIIEYYEKLAPFLLDYKNEEFGDDQDLLLSEYTEEEKQDPVVNYITKDEYRSLSTTERNQRALDRFWKRPKSKWLIGMLYERYVGYLYETKGYEVEYMGINERMGDLGRDLICKKGKEIIVIQCKNWSKFKKVFENSIFQFFGTVFKYRDENKDKNVRAVFYCTTQLSDLARRFARELNIELVENHKFDTGYPCIKCNISRVDGTKIYHLPFDQQYDHTKIDTKGELYVATVKEAEDKGFRRAWRWKGNV